MTKEILKYSLRRQAADPDLLPSLELPEFGWKYNPDDGSEASTELPPPGDPVTVKRDEVKGIVTQFKENNPTLSIEADDQHDNIEVCTSEMRCPLS